ncbi:hypothetical protein [Paraliobacillus ryukyuensis]|uniref:hypothetical protein n=1 Tax=Paraliobacillus ryukyuensis TaxID=200904 RepID=UPI0015C455C5|nr:hypothetical protein [Paraliobacillus ryukyuensis]
MSDESNLYDEAIERIDELVQDVIQTCDEVADKNHYEKEWVLDRFRDRFNKAKRIND